MPEPPLLTVPICLLGYELADVIDGELTERARAERWQQTPATGDLVASPGSRFQVGPPPGEQPLPVPAECLLRVPHFAAFDLLHQAASSSAGSALAREAALRGLGRVAAAVHEAPPHAISGLIRLDASAATVASRVCVAGGGGELGERIVEGPSWLFGREPAGTLAA
jgi:hypothetical protein